MDDSQSASPLSSEIMETMQSLLAEVRQIKKDNKKTCKGVKRVQEIIEKSSSLIKNSTLPNEMLIDAKILSTGSKYVSKNVYSLDISLIPFSMEKYRSGLLSFIENSSRMSTVNNEWECLAPATYHLFRKSHPVTFILGTLNLEPPPKKERAKTERQKKGEEPEKKVLTSLTENGNPVEEGSDVYDHILKWLVRRYKKNDKKPLSYFNFIIDPTNYWRSIENIFYFAFLVRDGSVKMSIHNGLPYVEPAFRNSEDIAPKKGCNYQFNFRLTLSEWKECIEKFQIESASIPPFTKKI